MERFEFGVIVFLRDVTELGDIREVRGGSHVAEIRAKSGERLTAAILLVVLL